MAKKPMPARGLQTCFLKAARGRPAGVAYGVYTRACGILDHLLKLKSLNAALIYIVFAYLCARFGLWLRAAGALLTALNCASTFVRISS